MTLKIKKVWGFRFVPNPFSSWQTSLVFFLLYFEFVYNPDPLPSPSMPTGPRAGEACDSGTPDPDAIWSKWAVVAWGLALAPSTCARGGLDLAVLLTLVTAFFNASWIALSMSALRSLRAEVSVIFRELLNSAGIGGAGLTTGWCAALATGWRSCELTQMKLIRF